MPVLEPGQKPDIRVALPQPVQQQPQRPPVSFGGEAPATPQQPAGPSGVPPLAPPQRRLSAVILPWSPPPKPKASTTNSPQQQPRQMRRRQRVRYSTNDHKQFQKAINAGDLNAAKVYADYLEERGLHGSPETLDTLRNSTRPLWVAAGPDGKVHAGRRWSMWNIRRHMNEAGSHWFSRESMSFFHTRLHGEPIHGPNGVYFVTSEAPPNSGRRYTVRSFEPGAVESGEQTSEGHIPRSPSIGTFVLTGHPDIGSARNVARRLAFDQPVDRASPAQMAGDFTGVPDVRPPRPEQMRRRVTVKRYSGETTEEHFHQMLDANPEDHNTRLVFADFLQERGDPRADGYRALGMLRKRPERDRAWHWWYGTHYHTLINHPTHSVLPEAWTRIIRDSGNYRPEADNDIKAHENRRHAEDAAAIAFSQLPPTAQQRITNPPQQMKRRRVRLSTTNRR